jgi:hypothetical protein
LLFGTYFALVLAASTGCSGFSSFCADAMDCEGGNDADTEACEIELDAAEEKAAIENCTEEFDAYFTCVEENSDCEDDNWTSDDKCEDEAEDLGDCL